MKLLNYLLVTLVSLILLACSPNNDAAKTKLFEEQRTALETAKTLDSSVQQQAQEMQKNVEKQTQ